MRESWSGVVDGHRETPGGIGEPDVPARGGTEPFTAPRHAAEAGPLAHGQSCEGKHTVEIRAGRA